LSVPPTAPPMLSEFVPVAAGDHDAANIPKLPGVV
jgi:hypothetical protein